MGPHLIGIGLALASAALWGCGDFAGGLGVRRGHPFRVYLMSALSGLLLLAGALFWQGEPWPERADLLWSLGAGASGALGITALYTGLARGRVAVVASTTAVVGAVLPVLFGFATHGLVAWPQLAGMTTALLGLFCVTRADEGSSHATGGLVFGVLAGLGVSGFLIGMAQLSTGVLWPLLLGRLMGALVAAVAILFASQAPRANWGAGWAIPAGLLDAGGNLLYVMSLQSLRLELAAVLTSLYPAVTVLLAARFLHQKLSPFQWLGVGLCLGGVALISWT